MGAVILENLLLLLGEGLKYHKKVRLSVRGVRIGAQLGAVRSENLLLVPADGVKISQKSPDYQRGVRIGAQLGAVRSEEEWGAGGVGTAQRSGEPPNNRSPTGHTP